MSDAEPSTRPIADNPPSGWFDNNFPISPSFTLEFRPERRQPTQSPSSSETEIHGTEQYELPTLEQEEQLPYSPRTFEQDVGNTSDSALGLDPSSSTVSLSPSVLRYETLNDRTYHSKVFYPYWGANDRLQQKTQEIQGGVFKKLLNGKLCHARLPDDIGMVLDLGTGCGQWAIDFADEHQQAQVIGTDISPMQPRLVPPNVEFFVDDFNKDFTWPNNEFDFVHARYLVGSVLDWNRLFQEIYRVLKPGGIIETFDCDAYIQCDNSTVLFDSSLGRWGSIFSEAFPSQSFRVVLDNLQKSALDQAGFEIIESKTYQVPLSPWQEDPGLREIGRLSREAIQNDVIGLIGRATDNLGWTRVETELFAMRVRMQLQTEVPSWYKAKAIWARKPARPPMGS